MLLNNLAIRLGMAMCVCVVGCDVCVDVYWLSDGVWLQNNRFHFTHSSRQTFDEKNQIRYTSIAIGLGLRFAYTRKKKVRMRKATFELKCSHSKRKWTVFVARERQSLVLKYESFINKSEIKLQTHRDSSGQFNRLALYVGGDDDGCDVHSVATILQISI